MNRRRNHRTLIVLSLSAVAGAAYCGSARAQTAAYWRHEEGTVGGLIPAGDDTVLDSSGNGYHMRTFDPSFTSATYSAAVSPLKLRSGLPNTMSLDFGPGGDDPGQNDDNYTTGNKLLNVYPFSAMTVELAFNMNHVGGFQALFGKDGKPLGDEPGEPDSPIPPLKIMVRGDDFPGAVPNQLFVEWIDGAGQIHSISNHQTVTAGEWYHVAFTLSADTASLWVANEITPYVKVDSITGNFKGPADEVLIYEPLGFSVGRGMYNNGVTDWADAKIDEVRITEGTLTPGQFLFAAGLPGDANMNGRIDPDDFALIDRGFARNLPPGTAGWTDGDFNYDGVVDVADYLLADTSYGHQGGTFSPGFLAGRGAEFGDAYVAQLVAAVPEPSVAGCGLAVVAALARRRRRPR
jgi:hypothetical protein